MTPQERITAAAVEAAAAAVWNAIHSRRGPWPDACDDPALWRTEEREALLPALAVLEAEGVLTWPTEEPEGFGTPAWWSAWRNNRLVESATPEHLCVVGERDGHPHDAHDWWYTSSGGGHQMSSDDPTEKNVKAWRCPGIEDFDGRPRQCVECWLVGDHRPSCGWGPR